ncbi:MAG: Ig-like domain-containing protein, partial [Patescibacteria group bacterium]
MIKSKKTAIVILFVLLLGILGYVIFVSKKTLPLPPEKGELKLVDINPSAGKVKILHPTTAILFYFNDPLVLSSIRVVIDPAFEIATELAKGDPKTLVVRPKEVWTYDTNYKIVIKSGLSSINNKELKEDLFYEIEFEAPDDIMSF